MADKFYSPTYPNFSLVGAQKSYQQSDNDRSYPNYPQCAPISPLSLSIVPEKPLRRRIIGLKNFGNTCYCNAPLQVLFSATKFCQWFINHLTTSQILNPYSKYGGTLLAAWLAILKEVFDSDSSPETLTSHIKLLQIIRMRHPQLEEDQQCDAHEFLRSFLDGLSAECNRVLHPPPFVKKKSDSLNDVSLSVASERFWAEQMEREHSIVTDFFGGLLVSRISCQKCGNVRHSFDFYLDISLETLGDESAKYVHLKDLLKSAYLNHSEIVHLDCPKCKLRSRSSVRTSIWRLPSEYLVIHIKRFRWDQARGLLRRVNARLLLPENGFIDMQPFCHLSEHASTKNAMFKLEGVISHAGTANSGHYLCETQIDGRWHCFSDEVIHTCIQPQFDTKGVYILFLRRLNSTLELSPAYADDAQNVSCVYYPSLHSNFTYNDSGNKSNDVYKSSKVPPKNALIRSNLRKDFGEMSNIRCCENDSAYPEVLLGNADESGIELLDSSAHGWPSFVDGMSEASENVRGEEGSKYESHGDTNLEEHLDEDLTAVKFDSKGPAYVPQLPRVCRLANPEAGSPTKSRNIFKKATERFGRKTVNPIVSMPKKTALSLFTFKRENNTTDKEFRDSSMSDDAFTSAQSDSDFSKEQSSCSLDNRSKPQRSSERKLNRSHLVPSGEVAGKIYHENLSSSEYENRPCNRSPRIAKLKLNSPETTTCSTNGSKFLLTQDEMGKIINSADSKLLPPDLAEEINIPYVGCVAELGHARRLTHDPFPFV